MQYAVRTDNLTRDFGSFRAVNNVDLRVERGSIFGFLGPNGAGKSTSIKMLTGILKPTSGAVSLLGLDPWNATEAIEIKQLTGVVPEDLALFDHLKAREYLTFVGQMYGLSRATIQSRSDELLSLLRLEGVDQKLTMEYSHGMKKKLALAAALLPNPELLFLDEPFEGVDAITSRVIRELLQSFISRGSTVFVTSHVLEIVERLCTHVGIIANGQLVEQASLEQLRRGASLEERFLDIAGPQEMAESRLSWLHDEEGESEASPRIDEQIEEAE